VKTISLNSLLARELYKKECEWKYTDITTIFINLMPVSTPVYLTDYEMLFDPRYKLDVMRLFCEASRHNKLIVKWCGNFDNDTLTYAQPGYDDYSKYKISDYKITCVI
jgi:hypothetical protein